MNSFEQNVHFRSWLLLAFFGDCERRETKVSINEEAPDYALEFTSAFPSTFLGFLGVFERRLLKPRRFRDFLFVGAFSTNHDEFPAHSKMCRCRSPNALRRKSHSKPSTKME